jgi:beta-glucosidase/6-phospho-beta-glucosidase/beta-galactosidase
VRKGQKVAADGSAPWDATRHHDLYRQDFKLMRELGVKHYRFSISWSRLVPGGTAGSAVSPAGAKFYSDFLDAMLAEGIQPAATLYHWDLPQVLQDSYGGFMDSDKFVKDYLYFAETAFKLYGNR